MHMADALLSPAVGGTMWVASAGVIACCCRRIKAEFDDRKIPLMGVLGAFIFAAQMINFTIPGTGSSGHIGGGMLLAILLGPSAAFLTIASVLFVQALFFADGGLLALGCNVFNLGFFPCFIAYPLVYRVIAGENPGPKRLVAAAVPAAVVGLQLGALAVIVQTVLSGLSELSFESFLLLMQPIHLAIGIVEGLVTAAVAGFIRRSQPEILAAAVPGRATARGASRNLVFTLAAIAVFVGGVLSWFSSGRPDGLEWALERSTGTGAVEVSEPALHRSLHAVQEQTAVLPDYGFREVPPGLARRAEDDGGSLWPEPDPGTTVSGLVGGLLTLAVALLVGTALKRRTSSG